MRTAAAFLLACLAFASAPAGARAADAAAAPAPAERTPEQMAALRKLILDGLADAKPSVRAAAAEAIVAAWPDSAPVLDEALAAKSASVRLEAVFILARETLGDQRERIAKEFDDASPEVRRQAIRIARHMDWPEAEPSFMRLLSRDPEWIVRQEALRGLERLGTIKCLRVVLEGWISESNADRRRFFKRVLVAVLKTDCGDSEDDWRTAIQTAEIDARTARK